MMNSYGKNVLITGGSSGIGLATAELLAENGYKVYSASRNPRMDVQIFTGGGEIHPVKMDVSDLLSVDNAAELLLTTTKTDIGIIIHCAGIGIACPGEEFPSDAISRLMETNYIGVLRVNSRLLPHLRERGSGLCIMVGSVAGLFPIPFQSHYSSSKSALDSYAAALRMELSQYGVKVCLVLPGDTNTPFTKSRSYDLDNSSPYYADCLKAVAKMEKDELSGRPPESSAKAIYKLCSSKTPPLRTIVGIEYKVFAFIRRLIPDTLIEYILRKMYLW